MKPSQQKKQTGKEIQRWWRQSSEQIFGEKLAFRQIDLSLKSGVN